MSLNGIPTADEIFGGAAHRRHLAETETHQPSAVPALRDTLHDLQVFIRKYVVVTDDQAIAIALWIAHTHVITAFDCTPYLQITSATKRAGKTRLLEVLEPLVARPWLTQRVSAAALVRKIDAEHPTLLLDESDAAFKGDKEYAEALRGLLNSGYRRSGCCTLCVGQGANLSYKNFSTFSAKAIAGIGELPDTVADRAIAIALKRRTQDELCARWRERDGHADATPLHDQLVAWAGRDRLIEGLRSARPTLPTGLGDRQADVWEPLLAIADLADADWPDRARRAALALTGSVEDTDIVVELLRDVAAILQVHQGDVIASDALLEKLKELDDRPWADWRNGHPISARALARLVKPLQIHPARHDTPAGRLRGYRVDAFTDAIARYLPIYPSMCPEPNKTGAELAILTCPSGPTVDGSKTAKTPITTASRTHGHIEAGEGGRRERL